jgi:hypothetical protein
MNDETTRGMSWHEKRSVFEAGHAEQSRTRRPHDTQAGADGTSVGEFEHLALGFEQAAERGVIDILHG